MHRKSGFSLVEMAVLLVIYGGIASMAVVVGREWTIKQEHENTKMTLDMIETALANYAIVNGRLPCPGDGTLTEEDDDFGYEAYESGADEATGECDQSNATGSGGSINSEIAETKAGSDFGVVIGSVPAKTLGIPLSMMRDAWKGGILYFVNERATLRGSFESMPTHVNYIDQTNNDVGAIEIRDQNGVVRTSKAMYALVSHGENQHGAYQPSGSKIVSLDVTNDELENCSCDTDADPDTIDNVLVDRIIGGNYDDLVRYKVRSHFLGEYKRRSITPTAFGNDTISQSAEGAEAKIVFSMSNMSFVDGNSAHTIIVPHSPDMALANGTVEAVFTRNARTSQGIVSKDIKNEGTGGHFDIYIWGGNLKVRLAGAHHSDDEDNAYGPINEGQQYHVAFTFGDAGYYVYLDGVLVESLPSYKINTLANNEALVLGALNWASSQGTTDDIRYEADASVPIVNIYNKALSAAEIAEKAAAY